MTYLQKIYQIQLQTNQHQNTASTPNAPIPALLIRDPDDPQHPSGPQSNQVPDLLQSFAIAYTHHKQYLLTVYN